MTGVNGRPTPFRFSSPEKVERILSQYPDRRSAALPLLHLAQEEAGYLTASAIRAVADVIGIHPAEMMDTVSFYSMFHTRPRGKYLLQVCQTLSCSLNGADELADHVCAKYGLRPGETSADGKFTLVKVECLGSCGTAPVVQVNRDYHESLTIQSLDKLLDSLP